MNNKRVAVITGGSSGIGEATGRMLAMHGFRVVLGARRKERLDQIAAEINQAGGDATAIPVDISVIESVRGFISESVNRYGRIDILVNNAGFGRLCWLEDMDPIEDIENQVNVNLVGVIQTTREALPGMIANRNGHIINIASMAGFVATPTYSVYAATKFGVRGFTEAVRREVLVWGIKVTGIYPGGVETEFAQHTNMARKTGITTPNWLRLSPNDVAETVLKVIRRPSPEVVIPGLMRVGIWFNHRFARLMDKIILRSFVIPERGS